MQTRPRDVLDFWFAQPDERYWSRDDAFDQEIAARFKATHKAALSGSLDSWMSAPEGALALVILLDQFSRNLYRDTPRAFAADPKALAHAKEAIGRRYDLEMPERVRKWVYMPFMHSEDLSVQEEGLRYFRERLDDPETLKFAEEHAEIIRRFGRFPHRNEVLGRPARPEETAYLDGGGFSP